MTQTVICGTPGINNYLTRATWPVVSITSVMRCEPSVHSSLFVLSMFIIFDLYVLEFFSYAAFDRSFIACLCFNTQADAVQTPHAARRLNARTNKYKTKEDIIRPLPLSSNYRPRSILFEPLRPALTMC